MQQLCPPWPNAISAAYSSSQNLQWKTSVIQQRSDAITFTNGWRWWPLTTPICNTNWQHWPKANPPRALNREQRHRRGVGTTAEHARGDAEADEAAEGKQCGEPGGLCARDKCDVGSIPRQVVARRWDAHRVDTGECQTSSSIGLLAGRRRHTHDVEMTADREIRAVWSENVGSVLIGVLA